MKKIVCDICGGDITGKWLSIPIIEITDERPDGKPVRFEGYLWEDVHHECFAQARKIYDGEPVKRKSNGRAPEIDRKKVMALREAGWTLPKIASELKCGTSSVSRIISEEKEKAAR